MGATDHPILDEARRIAASAPRGQKRILSIDRPLIYRLRHSNLRGATWLDEQRNVLWVLAVEAREEGSDEDAFAYVAELHATGRLLPAEDDELRRVAVVVDDANQRRFGRPPGGSRALGLLVHA